MTEIVGFALLMLVPYLIIASLCLFIVPNLFVDKLPRAPILLRSIWANQVMTLTAAFYAMAISLEKHPVICITSFICFLGFSINSALAINSKRNIKKIEKFANGEIPAPEARSITD